MKKTLFLALGFTLATSLASAGTGKWELQLGGGAEILASGYNPAYNLGVGLNVAGGYNFTENFSLWLSANGYDLVPPPANATLIVDEVVFSGRYTVSGKGVRPYFLAGIGSCVQIISNDYASLTESDLMAQVGAGIKIPAGNAFSLFAEAKGSFIFFPGETAVGIPINAGVLIGL